jgi:hypothetical protein
MSPRQRAVVQMLVLVGVVALLMLIFPPAFRFVEMAARELRYLWWLVLLVLLGVWLVWGAGRRPK